MKRLLIAAVAFVLAAVSGMSQEFGKYHPLYFTAGIPTSGRADGATADLKFQFGTSVTLFDDIGRHEGFDIDFVYNQVSVWNFFAFSSPFKDHMFMPALYLSVPVRAGSLVAGIEHRSNGRPLVGSVDEGLSRSVNYVFAEYGRSFSNGIVLKANLRAGFGWYEDEFTQDVFSRFLGYGDLTVGYRKGRLEAAVKATPVFGPFHVNLQAEAAYHVGACSVFVQYCRGYGEALADWTREGPFPAPHVRFGVLFGKIL